MFKGYLVDENGRYGEPIELDNPELSVLFVQENIDKYYEIIIVDDDGFIVMNTFKGKITFPFQVICEVCGKVFITDNDKHKACIKCYRNSGLPEMIEEMFKEDKNEK
jgi:hypothetical protein